MTFAQKFCVKNSVHPGYFDAMVLRLTLRPIARFLRPILNLGPNYFPADASLFAALLESRGLRNFELKSRISLTIRMDAASFITGSNCEPRETE